jgi:hypothetical protein
MSAETVNLRQARKAKARAEKEAQAAENRVKFGRSKAEKRLAAATEDLAARRLDGAKRAASDDQDQR